MKRFLSLILTLSMLLSMCAFAMPAAEVVESSDEITNAAVLNSEESATLMGEDGYVVVFEQDFEGMTAQTATNILAPASTIDPYKKDNFGYAPRLNKTVTNWYKPETANQFTFYEDTVNNNKYLRISASNWQYMGISFADVNYGLTLPGDYRLTFDIVCEGRVVSNPAWNSNSYPYTTTKPDYYTITSTDISATLKPNGKRTVATWTIREEDSPAASAPTRFAARLAYQFNTGSGPYYGVDNIKLEYKAPPIKAVEVSGIDAPEANLAPDMTATVPTGANYTVKSITWSPEVTDVFASPVAYTANVVLTPNANYEFASAVTAKFNGETVPATVDAVTGDVTLSYTFPETIYKEPITVTITSGTEITTEPGSIELSATVATVNPEAVIDSYDVVWSIDNDRVAILDGTTLKALRNGQVTVTATSVYDASVSAIVVVTISNQTPDKTITFDKGTLADVANMPENIVDKGHIHLPYEKPTREGFVFGGWSTEKYNYDAVITELDLKKDITLYATWYKAGLIVDYDSNTDKLPSGVSNITYGPSYIEYTLDSSAQISWTGDWILDASKYTTLEVKLATTATNNEEIITYFASIDKDGNRISGTWSGGQYQNQAEYGATAKRAYFYGSGSLDTFQTVFMDMTTNQNGTPRNTWRDNIINFRVDIGKRSAGQKYRLDYIRFVNPVIEEVAITGIDTPVVREEADTDAVAVDSSKYKVVDVSWEEALLYDYYFDGSTAYTVNVTLAPQKGVELSSKPYATINGYEAYTKKYNDDGTVVVAYTFPATEPATATQASKITLVEENNEGEVLNERMVFVDTSIRLDTYAPLSKPDNKRWVGWTSVKNDASTMVTSVSGVEEKTLYALYEAYDNFDFSNSRHYNDITIGEFGSLSFDGVNAIVTAASNTDDTYIATVPTLVKAADYGKVEVIYDGKLSGVYNEESFSNRFTPSFKPALYFSSAESANTLDTNNMATLLGGERITIDGVVCYKYTYDVACHDNWNGTIGKLFLDPYNGFPAWGVRSIKLIKNDPINETVNITGITTPVTWNMPSASAQVQNIYNVIAVEWSPELNEQGAFMADTAYTVTVKVKPDAGFKFEADTLATIDGEDTVVEIDESANILSASYTYEATLPLVPVTVTIEGSDVIVREGRYETYTAKVVSDSYVPNNGIIWTVRGAEDDESVTTTEIAQITQSGRLYPTLNGNVIVTATSIYDPSAKAEIQVAISGQTDKNTVTFDKNTTQEVTNIPEPVYVKGVYIPETQVPVREGFAFLGWSDDPDAYSAQTSFTISEDTTLYAVWAKGFSFEFNSQADIEGFKFSNMGTPVLEDGCLVFTPTSTDPIMEKSVEFNVDDFKNVDVRFSAESGSHFQVFFKTASATSFNETNSSRTHYSKTNGAFTTIRVDMAGVSAWKGIVTQLRLDPCNTLNNKMKIDYIRFVDDNRLVTFNANGGVMLESGEPVGEIMRAIKIGDYAPNFAPTREGYKFMGWANNPEGTGRLYNNGKVPATDDRTFYAVWNVATSLKNLSDEYADTLVSVDDPELQEKVEVSSNEKGLLITAKSAVVAPVVKITDTMVVNESSSTLLLQYAYNYKSVADSTLRLRFRNEAEGEFKYITIKENLPNRSNGDYIYFDLSQSADWTGEIFDVALVLQEGTISSYTISELTLTSEEIAKTIVDDYMTSDKPTSGGESFDDSGAKKEFDVVPAPERPNTAPVTTQDPSTVTKFTTLTQGEGTITIGFDSDISKEVVDKVSGFKNNGYVNGILKLEADGTGENSITTVDGLAVDAKTHRFVAIKAAADLDKGAKVKVYFRTNKDSDFIEANSVTSEITGQNSIAVFDMGKLSGWSDTVVQVKFVFEGGAKGTVDVDYIMFANAAPSNPAVEEKLEAKFSETTTNIPDFADVADSNWFSADVDKAVALGFMKGRNDTTFDPNGDVSVAEIITVAARAHAIYFGKELNETAAAGEKWYAPFVDYAIENNIISKGQYADYEAAATRYQVATIIVKAVDKTWLKEINAFTQVPDVLSTLPGYMDILALYKAGVVIGVDAQFNYLPENTIKRCEIAAIINRLALPESRKTVEVK